MVWCRVRQQGWVASELGGRSCWSKSQGARGPRLPAQVLETTTRRETGEEQVCQRKSGIQLKCVESQMSGQHAGETARWG